MDALHHEALKRLAETVEPDLPAMLDEQEAAVVRELPEVAGRIDPVLLRDAIDRTNRRFIATLAGDTRLRTDRDVHVELGAVCARAGLSLESVTSAYRLGARVSWRRMTARVDALQLPTAVVLRLAEGWIAYVEELTADSLEGYEREAAVARGVRARAGQELVQALLAGGDVEAAAERAAWEVPEAIAVGVPLAPAGPDDAGVGGVRIRPPSAGHVVTGTFEGGEAVVVPAADLAHLTAPVALGPAVAPHNAAVSLARAKRVAGLVAAGHIAGDGPVRWEDHLADLVVHADARRARR